MRLNNVLTPANLGNEVIRLWRAPTEQIDAVFRDFVAELVGETSFFCFVFDRASKRGDDLDGLPIPRDRG